MKLLSEIKNRRPSGKPITSGRVNRVKFDIYRTAKGFEAYVDGDYLDKFRTERDAKKAAETAIKELT
jgi:hypothetical protein